MHPGESFTAITDDKGKEFVAWEESKDAGKLISTKQR